MAFTINWVEPSNTGVGSVLVYKADTLQLDSLGSRTIIVTTAAKDSNGSFITTYTDTSGTVDNIYRIQFWDGVGSSLISNRIGEEFAEQLATYDDVVRLARLQNNNELGSAEVRDAIQDATDEVWTNYGDPIKKTSVYIDSETGVSGQAYDFTGDYVPIYQLREVIIDDGTLTQLADSTMYEVSFVDGNVKFTDEFIGSFQGKNVLFHWVPSITNLFVKYQAAVNLLEGELIFTGIDVTNPQVQRLQKKVSDIMEIMRPKGVFSIKSFADNIGGIDGYESIPQRQNRTSLYFTN